MEFVQDPLTFLSRKKHESTKLCIPSKTSCLKTLPAENIHMHVYVRLAQLDANQARQRSLCSREWLFQVRPLSLPHLRQRLRLRAVLYRLQIDLPHVSSRHSEMSFLRLSRPAGAPLLFSTINSNSLVE